MFISSFPSQILATAFALPEKEKALTSDYFITLSITRTYTTYTTIIQLGNGQMTPTTQVTPPTPQPTASSSAPIVYNNSNGISGGGIAAIVGCILGALVVLAVFCTCWRGKRGSPGKHGDRGEPGADGRDGAPGARGQDGRDGAPGVPGVAGQDGRDGAPGVAGAAGSRDRVIIIG